MTSIFAGNTRLPIASTKRRMEAVTQKTDSLGKLTFSSPSLPKSSGFSEFIVSTSCPRNAMTDDSKEDKKGEEAVKGIVCYQEEGYANVGAITLVV